MYGGLLLNNDSVVYINQFVDYRQVGRRKGEGGKKADLGKVHLSSEQTIPVNV